MWENITGLNKSEFMDNNLSEEGLLPVILNNKVVGLGATILNGYSYRDLLGNLTIYTSVKDFDGMDCLTYRLVYLPDYEAVSGYENSTVASPERNICDYLKYPEKLNANVYLLDALEGYIEEKGDLEEVYRMMKKLGLSNQSLQPWLDSLYCGSNMCGE